MDKHLRQKRISTGIRGLDEILFGGYIDQRSYLVRGGPGSGKTTLGLHFLLEGIENDEETLYITLTEPKDKIIEEVRYEEQSIVKRLNFLDLSPKSNILNNDSSYNIFHSGEIEWDPLIEQISKKIVEIEPKRIFLDCITQLYHLDIDKFQFRKKVLSLIQFIRDHNATVLISSEAGDNANDDDVQFICDGIINLDNNIHERNLNIVKFRNSDFKKGKHTVKLTDNGMRIYPILTVDNQIRDIQHGLISSGIEEIDSLLNGGIERGTDTILSGPSGVGKTTLGIQFMKEAAQRGEHSVVYTFEESVDVIVKRCEALNIPINDMLDEGSLLIKQINPIEFSPNEFAQMVRTEVEENDTSIVMIDSVAGFKLSFNEDIVSSNDMIRNLHAISNYLTNQGITVLLINEIEAITGETFKVTEYGISYLADNLIFLRYLEINGTINKAIGVLKKRLSNFEKSLREFAITERGIEVGSPIEGMEGILTGNPSYVGDQE